MDSWFARVFLIPSSVVLSVMFGGAFGSGREVAQFVSRHGATGGLLSIAIISVVYMVVLFMCFELARKFREYEYRGFTKLFLGRAWYLYEILVLIAMTVAIAVCTTAAGEISSNHFEVPTLAGAILLLLIIGGLNYFGRTIIERSMILAVIALLATLVYMLVLAITNHSQAISDSFTGGGGDPGAVVSGLQYSLSSAGLIPILLYCARGLNTRLETLMASVCAGIVGILPALPLHISFMVGFPSIVDEVVPTYTLLGEIASPLFLNIYIAIVFVMVAQTGVGLLHGLLERIDTWVIERKGTPMSAGGHAFLAGGLLVASIALASIGLVELVIAGYAFFSVAFLLVFYVPLFTYGSYKAWVAIPSLEER
jgi:uncharacterized membrane protein YkvI